MITQEPKEVEYIYKATGTVNHHAFPVPFHATSRSYKRLVEDIYKHVEGIRYYTEGVNGGINSSELEPYTKNLIWPEVKITITREIIKDEN